MTQGAMRVEEYECHFMKMMRYTPDDTHTDQKKQFWFLQGLHHVLRQGLKASGHKSLSYLVNRAIAVEDERRSQEERMKARRGWEIRTTMTDPSRSRGADTATC
jgi:hypothetical protein